MATTTLVLLFLAGGLILLAGLVLVVPAIRRPIISRPVMKFMAKVLPSMSDTERIALEAGTVWWDAELFSGRPDWRGMLATQLPGLSRQEEAFLSGPVERVCAMTDDWQTTLDHDLAPEVWPIRLAFFQIALPFFPRTLSISSTGDCCIVLICFTPKFRNV